MFRFRCLLRASLATAALLGCSAAGSAETRYALIVSGATGGQEYVAQYNRWSAELSRTLVEGLKFETARVTVLSEAPRSGAESTAENVRRTLASIRARMTRDDLLLIVLIGHGTFDGIDAKFNLVGPDLESAEWSALLRPLPGRVVVVNTTSGSFPFLERLAAPRRNRDHRNRFVRAAVRHGVPGVPSSARCSTTRRTSTRTDASRSGKRLPRPAATSRATISSADSSRPSVRSLTTTATASAR